MNLRTKKTLGVLLRGAIVLACSTLFGLARGGHFGVNPLFFVFVALFLAIAGYTWWWYGDSPKAVAVRAKVEAKKAARQQLS
ncbi:hypothetical protein [Kitasatospora xanthocidica]|uniref:hypothetical protein n=1 Tax=Kitasatospora xanthocidica TaxID=83382 RepID=UPI0016747E79|nr:hypothetical protein [Kitasatospora xanthocidica]